MHLAGIVLLVASLAALEPDRDLPLTYRVIDAAGFPGWRRVEVTVENKTPAPLVGEATLDVLTGMNRRRESYEGPVLAVGPGDRGEAVFLVPPTQGAQARLRVATAEGIPIVWSQSQHLGWTGGGQPREIALATEDTEVRRRLAGFSIPFHRVARLARFRPERARVQYLLLDASLLEGAAEDWADTLLAWSGRIRVVLFAPEGGLRGLGHPLVRRAFGLVPERSELRNGTAVVRFRAEDAAAASVVLRDEDVPLLYAANGEGRQLFLLPFEPTPAGPGGGDPFFQARLQALPPLGNFYPGMSGLGAASAEPLLASLAPEVPIRGLLLLLLVYVAAVPILFFATSRLRREAANWILLPGLALGAAALLFAWSRVGPGSANRLAGGEVEVRSLDGSVRRHVRLALFAGAGFHGDVSLPGEGAGTLHEFDIPGNEPAEVWLGPQGRTVSLTIPPRSGTVLEAVAERPGGQTLETVPEPRDWTWIRRFDAATGRWQDPDGSWGDVPRFEDDGDSILLSFLETGLRAGGEGRYRVGILPGGGADLPAGFAPARYVRFVALQESEAAE